MIKRLIEWCTRRPGIVLGLVGASLVYAVISFRSLSLDALPDLSDPQVIVYTKWPRSPEVIQRHLTRPLILALNGIPGVKTVRGVTDFGFSYVFIIFDERTDTVAPGSRFAKRSLRCRAPCLPECSCSWVLMGQVWVGVQYAWWIDRGSTILPRSAVFTTVS